MKSFISLFFSLIISACAITWFSQNSLNAYWQQTYHQTNGLESLEQWQWWQTGAQWQEWAYQTRDDWKARLDEANHSLPANIAANAETELPNTAASDVAIAASAAMASEPAAAMQPAPTHDKSHIVLKKGDKVFFAGDSLMQGVAPFVQRTLKQQYNIESINLSKQSTGLSYPSFFDWPATIEKTLAQHSDITLLVVFLGPNDPWDIPNPKGGAYLKFQSPEWESIYTSRIERILQAAQKHHVAVIWLGIPFMKKAKLNEHVRYLDRVIEQYTHQRVKHLPTAKLLSNGADQYNDSVTIDGKIVRYRSKDGIHFSTTGQKLLADYIMQAIQVQP